MMHLLKSILAAALFAFALAGISSSLISSMATGQEIDYGPDTDRYLQERQFMWSACSDQRGELMIPLDTNDAPQPADPSGHEFLRECLDTDAGPTRRAIVIFAGPDRSVVLDVYDPNGETNNYGYGKYTQRITAKLTEPESFVFRRPVDDLDQPTGGDTWYSPGSVMQGTASRRFQLRWREPFGVQDGAIVIWSQ